MVGGWLSAVAPLEIANLAIVFLASALLRLAVALIFIKPLKEARDVEPISPSRAVSRTAHDQADDGRAWPPHRAPAIMLTTMTGLLEWGRKFLLLRRYLWTFFARSFHMVVVLHDDMARAENGLLDSTSSTAPFV